MIGNTMKEVILSIWPMLLIFLIVMVVVRIFYLIINKKEFVFYQEIINLGFILYILLLFELVTSTEISGGDHVNWIPFTEIFRYDFDSTLFYQNVLGNIIIFIPFGYFISDYIKAKKIWHILFISLITSCTIEFVQFQIGRSADVDDVLLNVAGGIIGFLIYIALTAIKKHLPALLQKNIVYNIIWLIILLLVVFYLLRLYNIWWF